MNVQISHHTSSPIYLVIYTIKLDCYCGYDQLTIEASDCICNRFVAMFTQCATSSCVSGMLEMRISFKTNWPIWHRRSHSGESNLQGCDLESWFPSAKSLRIISLRKDSNRFWVALWKMMEWLPMITASWHSAHTNLLLAPLAWNMFNMQRMQVTCPCSQVVTGAALGAKMSVDRWIVKEGTANTMSLHLSASWAARSW